MEHKNAEILRAIADGKQVQWKNEALCNNQWYDFCIPNDTLTLYLMEQLGAEYLQWRIKPEKKKGWINIYPDAALGAEIFPTKNSADECAGVERIACIEIEYEEGQGL